MPRGYRGHRKISLRRRRGVRHAAKSVASAAHAAYRGMRFVKKLINVEKKFFDTHSTQTPVTATGGFESLCDIPQGDTAETREGRSLRLKSVQVRGRISQDALASTTFVRVMLVADTRPNAGEITAATDVLQAGFINPVTGLANKAVGGRFRTLKDKVFRLYASQTQISAADSRVGGAVVFNWYKKLDKHVLYTGSATDDPQNYNLYIITFTTEATNSPDCEFDCRVTFIDN